MPTLYNHLFLTNLRVIKRHINCSFSISIRVILAITILMPIGAGSQAANWHAAPNAIIGSEYNDNPLLLANDGRSAWGFTTQADLTLRTRSETSEVVIKPRLRSAQYDSPDALDHDDGYLDISGQIQYPRSDFSIGLSYADESTRTSEILDSGRVQFRIPVENISLNTDWFHSLTQKNRLGFVVSAARVEYENSPESNFIDYEYSTLGLSFQHQIKEGTTGSLTVSGSKFDAISFLNKQNTLGLELGLNHSFTERLALNARVGSRETEFRSDLLIPGPGNTILRLENPATTDDGTTLDLSLSYALGADSFTASASRTLLPSSRGIITERSEVRLRYSNFLSALLSVNTELVYFENSDVGLSDSLGGRNREFSQFIIESSWRVSRRWRLKANYRYNVQELDTINDSAESNFFGLTLSYAG